MKTHAGLGWLCYQRLSAKEVGADQSINTGFYFTTNATMFVGFIFQINLKSLLIVGSVGNRAACIS